MAARTKQSERKLMGELKTSAHKIWLAGLGALSMAEQEGSRVFGQLVTRGEAMEGRGKKRVSSMKKSAGNAWESFGEGFEARVAGTLRRLGVPTKEDVERISRRLDRVEKAMRIRKTASGGTPARKATRKTTARKKKTTNR